VSDEQRHCNQCGLHVEAEAGSCRECGGDDLVWVSGLALADRIARYQHAYASRSLFGEDPVVRCAFCGGRITAAMMAERCAGRANGQKSRAPHPRPARWCAPEHTPSDAVLMPPFDAPGGAQLPSVQHEVQGFTPPAPERTGSPPRPRCSRSGFSADLSQVVACCAFFLCHVGAA
jgi:hypothetical protein